MSSTCQDLLNQGKILWETGDIIGAIKANEQAFALNPESVDILNNLGILQLQNNNISDGIDYLKKAIHISPDSADAYNNLATFYIRTDKLAEAISYIAKVLEKYPDNFISLRLSGDIYLRKRNYPKAIKQYKKNLELNYFDTEIRTNLGKALLLNKQHELAKQELRIALEFEPGYYPARINLATIYYDQFEISKALKNVDLILKDDPHNKLALQHGGTLAMNCHHWLEAKDYLERLYQTDINNIDYNFMLANAYRANGMLADSIKLFTKIIDLYPDNIKALAKLSETQRMLGDFKATNLTNQKLLEIAPEDYKTFDAIALLNKDIGNFDVAEENLNLAMTHHEIDLDDNTSVENLINDHLSNKDFESQPSKLTISNETAQQHLKLAMFYLYKGDFEKGWIEYQWRFQTQQVIWLETSKPMWQGEDLTNKKLLIWNEQGFGDTLQFIRYIELIKDFCNEIIILCQQRIKELLANSFPYCTLVDGDIEDSEYDFHFPLLSLPTIIGCHEKDIPNKVPYLSYNKSLLEKFLSDFEISKNKLNVGLVWSGNKEFPMDFLRSPGLKPFLPIFEIKNIQFYSFQYGDEKNQITELNLQDKIVDLTEYSNGFDNDAAIMQSLDLIISSDTATVHLAGGLGIKTWCILPYSPDWRWMHSRNDSPWYPSMTLYRQHKPLDWINIFEKIKLDLEELVLSK